MTGKKQKRKSSEVSEGEVFEKVIKIKKEDGQSPSKKQKKKHEQKVKIENEAVVSNTNGETAEKMPPSKVKRLKSRQRKLAAIAKIKEEGGVPMPLYPKKKDKKPKSKETGEAQQKDPKTIEQKLKAKQEKRDKRNEKRKEDGQYKVGNVNMSADMIKLRIEEIKGRGELTKSAKRRLGVLKKKLMIEEGTFTTPQDVKNLPGQNALSKSEKRRIRREKKGEEGDEVMDTGDGSASGDPAEEKLVNIQLFKKLPIRKEQTKQNKGADKQQQQKIKQVQSIVKVEPAKVESVEPEEDSEEDEDEEEEDEQETELNSSQDNDAEDESDEEDEEENVSEEDKPQVKKEKVVVKPQKVKKVQPNQQEAQEKKKRFVLFVGNIPYDTKVEDLKNHFLTKVSEVSSVRIPTESNSKKPRGFAYVEVLNDVDYEKGISLHHTFVNGRRINVEYTLGGSKQATKSKDLVAKNQKLHAMRKAGKLAGSQKHDQKRSVRRQKVRQLNQMKQKKE